MDFLKQNKMMIGGGVALVIAIFVYFTYFSGSSSTPALTTSDQATTVSQNLLVTLQNLHTIKLDESIFSNPVFLSLTDFGVTIPPENVGRQDPFAPLGGVSTTKAPLALPTSGGQ
jgi:hypothetical protein